MNLNSKILHKLLAWYIPLLYIYSIETNKKTENMTPSDLRIKLETKQAKAWGYKSIKEANKDGYNVTRTNFTISEVRETFKLSINEATRLAEGWKFNGLVKRVQFADLDHFIFI